MAPHIALDDIREVHKQRISDLALCRRNWDTPCANAALANIMSGQPAYWYFGRSSAASHVAPGANAKGSLIAALEGFAERHPHVGIAEDILDRLIPLNAEAIAEMELAYRLQSTFRDRYELETRERDAIIEAYFPANLTIDTRLRWGEEYAAARRRFDDRQRDAHWSRPVTTPRHLDAVAIAEQVQ